METAIPKPCPDCGQIGGLTLRKVLVARPVGTWSLAGMQDKTSALERVQLACSLCGRSRTSRLEGIQADADGVVIAGHFVEETEGGR